MAMEIERRFLVCGDQWQAHVRWRRHLQQGYLAVAGDGLTVRVRQADGQAWLTIKGRPRQGAAVPDWVRQEFEYPIPAGDAEALLALAPVRLSKWRHGLDLPGGEWVLDVFEGDNAPLVVVEVELPDADQPLALPPWCGLELTGRPELSNAALAHQPFAHWPLPQRQALMAQPDGATAQADA